MKRSRFVANSSSSSFICSNKAGFSIEQVTNILKEFYEMARNLYLIKYPDAFFPETFDEMFGVPFFVEEGEASETYQFYMEDWGFKDDWRLNQIKTDQDFIGKLIINGADDNTIPYGLFELIEWTFDGYRLHLG